MSWKIGPFSNISREIQMTQRHWNDILENTNKYKRIFANINLWAKMDVEDGFNAEDLFGGKSYGPNIFWIRTRKGCFIQILQRKQQWFLWELKECIFDLLEHFYIELEFTHTIENLFLYFTQLLLNNNERFRHMADKP